eukprot:12618367-Alexandrium_andersonii.AAC.1
MAGHQKDDASSRRCIRAVLDRPRAALKGQQLRGSSRINSVLVSCGLLRRACLRFPTEGATAPPDLPKSAFGA